MTALKWSQSHAVFVTEIDDEHREIFDALSSLKAALADQPPWEIKNLLDRLAVTVQEHFAHEERLMQASRYEFARWHKSLHAAALRRVREYMLRADEGAPGAALEVVKYLNSWLDTHTRVADQMLGSFLRNRRRTAKITFHAGTKPLDACAWVGIDGEPFVPKATKAI